MPKTYRLDGSMMRRRGSTCWICPVNEPAMRPDCIRRVVMALALVGCGIAAYLARFELGWSTSVWDPVFGSATSEAVLTSSLSRALPVPDAALGACAYAVEFALAAIGGPERWRERPWIVLVFGVVVAALAVAAVALVLSQVLIVHAFCSLCLGSALISFINTALAREEVFASVRVLQADARRKHLSYEPDKT